VEELRFDREADDVSHPGPEGLLEQAGRQLAGHQDRPDLGAGPGELLDLAEGVGSGLTGPEHHHRRPVGPEALDELVDRAVSGDTGTELLGEAGSVAGVRVDNDDLEPRRREVAGQVDHLVLAMGREIRRRGWHGSQGGRAPG
jgi:hypothetical protein